jgi:hypothetical protein
MHPCRLCFGWDHSSSNFEFYFWRVGMNSSVDERQMPLATQVKVTDDTLSVDLSDGRTILVPLAWYPRLSQATGKERKTWRLIAGGQGIHWPELDEDICVANLLSGQPSAESQDSLKKWLAARARRRPRPGKG